MLQSLHNLSDDRTEYLIRDRISFMRFLDLELEDPVPDATTIWLFREALAQAGLINKLFERFGQHLEAEGYTARGGQIIDATIVSVPKQRNTKEENETIKEGETPEDWKSKPAKNRQKDKDARWTKKHERSYFGYKNHIGVDRRHKFVRRYVVSDASVHDSQKFEDVLDASNTASDVWADSAYRSAEIEEKLAECGLKSRIHRRAYRNRKLSEAQKAANTTRSKVRARVEHVFGDQKNGMGAELVRTIGIARAMQNRNDEPRLQHAPAGSARAAGGCASLSTLTGGRVASCNGARGRPPGIKTAPDRGLTWARALHSFAQLRAKSPKPAIVRGAFEYHRSFYCLYIRLCGASPNIFQLVNGPTSERH